MIQFNQSLSLSSVSSRRDGLRAKVKPFFSKQWSSFRPVSSVFQALHVPSSA
jgi:hypothetical protein